MSKIKENEEILEVLEEVNQWIEQFQKTLGFYQLSMTSRQSAKRIIYKFSEQMLYEHNQVTEDWEYDAFYDTVICLLPLSIIANIDVFEQVELVLDKYFTFLIYEKKLEHLICLKESLPCVCHLMMNEVYFVAEQEEMEELAQLADELGLDLSHSRDIEVFDVIVDEAKIKAESKKSFLRMIK